VVDLLRGLPHEEETARDQDDVSPREAMAEQFEHRIRQLDDDRDGRQKGEPHDQRGADAQPPRVLLVFLGKLVGQDGNEDQVVDPQHHLQNDQRAERDPGRRLVDPVEITGEELHLCPLLSAMFGRQVDKT
jgi:hypothetical protein